ncbi:hypothetical protein [Dysgonomonas macrotermitis]|uniref:Uncharacterized protein n=1 Tax=Dysgonomonas macrotermitis TaxID=1346286 RepID=A0A1M5J002_9BACT|nr:hypothetical protein [Dysgonomonas macrotermitis]SHG33540.1 hypothetical protein SAMN05444362_12163 [Dysgonomonas macrotermitis]
MVRTIEMKEGDTIVGLFKKLKKPGDILHVKDEIRRKARSISQEATRQNKYARMLNEISQHELKYSVIVTEKEGYTTIRYVDNTKVESV